MYHKREWHIINNMFIYAAFCYFHMTRTTENACLIQIKPFGWNKKQLIKGLGFFILGQKSKSGDDLTTI